MKIEHQLAKQWITPNSRVLDLGCGSGDLLHYLQVNVNTRGYGIEMNEQKINDAIAKGVNVIEQDLNGGLANFADNSFDTVIMARTLQAVQKPDELLLDMLRVGRQVIITFPNFAHWQNRLYLGLKGKMPVSDVIPYEWYNTPNIHLSTLQDFEELCDQHDIKILNNVAVVEERILQKLTLFESRFQQSTHLNKFKMISDRLHQGVNHLVTKSPNLLSEFAVYRVTTTK